MPGALVDALHGFGVGGLGDAPHHAGVRIAPGSLEVDALVVLDVEVGLVGSLQCLGSYTMHAVMDVHELGHRIASARSGYAAAGPPPLDELYRTGRSAASACVTVGVPCERDGPHRST